MASSPLPLLEQHQDLGLPSPQRPDQGPTITGTTLESQRIESRSRTPSHSNSTNEPSYPHNPQPPKQDKAVPAAALKQEAGIQNRQNTPRPPRQPRTPSLGPSIPDALRKRVNDVRNKISNPRNKPLARLEGTEAMSGRVIIGQESPLETSPVQIPRSEAAVHESFVLQELSDASTLSPPSIGIIAVHDQWQTPATAWAYNPPKDFPKRPGPLPEQAYPSVGETSASVDTSQLAPAADKTDAKAGSKALGGNKAALKAKLKGRRGRRNRSGRESGHNPEGGAEDQSCSVPDDGIQEEASEKVALPPDTTAEVASNNGYTTTLSNQPTAVPTDEREERFEAQIDSPTQVMSSSKDTRSPFKKGKSEPPETWLTSPSMIAGDFHGPRVLAFKYKPLEPKQSAENPSKRLDYNRYLTETAGALLFRIKADRAQNPSKAPLVLIADGFGCLIIQKFITLATESEENSAILDMIAALVFFDAPSPTQSVQGESNNTQDKPNELGIVAPPVSSGRGARIKNILESRGLHIWDLWAKFRMIVQRKHLSTLWFYAPSQASNPPPPLRTVCIHFVALKSASARSAARRSMSRFKGPDDLDYRSFVDYTKRFLLLKASAHHELEESLLRFIDSGYELRVTDHKGRSPLHWAAECANYAALFRLATVSPGLVVEGDEEGLTPLHLVVLKAIRDEPGNEERGPFKEMIKKLLFALAEIQHEDDLKDKSGKSAWEYASGDKHRWIRELRNSGLLNGARAARPEKIEDTSIPLSEEENASCRKSDAILAQFYIARDGSTDYWDHQQPEVHMAIYDQKFGVEKLFEMNLRPTIDKRPTCRWIHLPANNEKWVHDLFARQLQRIDKSLNKRRHQGLAPFNRHIIPGALRYNQHYEGRSGEWPFPSPKRSVPLHSISVQTTGSEASKKTATALFIPIFGFERHKYREKLSQRINSTVRLPGDDETSMLIRGYFDNKKFPLHCRRTLDQFTYHMLKDTESRDNTQVIFKAQDKSYCIKPQLDLQSYRDQGTDIGMWPQLMVDQLWLWILDDEKTVITSVPNTWDSSESFNLVRFLMRNELTENDERPLIEGPWDLANSIIRCSVDFLQRKGPRDATLSECFQSSINVVAAEQAKEFARFQRLVEKLNKRGIDQEKMARLTNKLFRLTNATRLMAEIMDIQDELKIINEVLHKQREGLQKFAQILASDGKKDKTDEEDESIDGLESPYHGSPSPEAIDAFQSADPQVERKLSPPLVLRNGNRLSARRSFHSVDERVSYNQSKPLIQAKANLHLIESNITTIEELRTHAEKVRLEINGVLSHRQKHANAWEARFAREGSEYTQRQSNVTLVFTTVTVFFLPLTFMSSILALQIDVFPHNPETGELNWSLEAALSLVFGISFGMIFLIALFAFYINRVSRLFWRLFGRATALSTEPSNYGHHHDSDSDSDASTVSSDSRRSNKTAKSMLFSRRIRNKSKRTSESEDLDYSNLRYAPIFGTWYFHTKIPLLRNLWRFHMYPSLHEKVSHPQPSAHDADFTGQSRDKKTANSSEFHNTEKPRIIGLERDFPLRHALLMSRLLASDRILRPMQQLVPTWLQRKDNADEAEYDNDCNGDYDTHDHPPMSNPPRDFVPGNEDGWDESSGPLRESNTQPLRQKKTSNIFGLIKLPWRMSTVAATSATNEEDSEAGVTAGVAVIPEPHHGGPSIGHPNNDDVREKRSEDRKANANGVSLPHFGRSKTREEDPESQLGMGPRA